MTDFESGIDSFMVCDPPLTGEECTTHVWHELNVVTAGRIHYRLGDEVQLFTPGMLLALPSMTPHVVAKCDGLAQMYGIHLHPDLFSEWFAGLSPQAPPSLEFTHQVNMYNMRLPTGFSFPDPRTALLPRLHMDPAQFAPRSLYDDYLVESAVALIEMAAKEYQHYGGLSYPHLFLSQLMRSLAVIFLRVLSQPEKSEVHAQAAPKVRAARAYIDQHFDASLTIEELAKQAELSRAHFSVLFHRIIGMPPKSYLLHVRLTHAAQLLVQSELSIEEIAKRCGFAYPEHLHRLFKSHNGVSLQAYRKQHKIS